MNDFFKKVGSTLSSGYKSAVSGLGSFIAKQGTPTQIASNVSSGLKNNPLTAPAATAVNAFSNFLGANKPKTPTPAQASASITAPVAQPKNLTQAKPTVTKVTTPNPGQSNAMNSMVNTPNQVQGTSTVTPEVPLITPASPVDTTSTLKKTLLSTYEETPEEKATAEALVALNDSYRLGQEGITNQRIPLTDIQGQAASAERRYTNRAATLQDTLALQQAQRTQKQQRANKELELATGEKPIEVGNKLVQKQADGTYKEVFTAPTSSSEGFTLGKDQVRYDAQGNPIAGGGTGSSSTGEVSKQTLNLVNSLLGAGNLGSITGLIQSPASLIPGSSQQLLKNTYNQLKSLLSLENRTLLKGSGAISDYEARTLEKAATKLGRNLSDKDFIAVLKELQSDLMGGANSTSSVTLPSGEVINTNW